MHNSEHNSEEHMIFSEHKQFMINDK